MCVLIISCNSKIKPLTAQQIIDKSIISSGVDKLANSSLSFDFRKNHYMPLEILEIIFLVEGLKEIIHK